MPNAGSDTRTTGPCTPPTSPPTELQLWTPNSSTPFTNHRPPITHSTKIQPHRKRLPQPTMIAPLLARQTARAACRTAFRRSALPFGISSGLILAYHQHTQPMRLDAVPVSSRHYASARAPDVVPEVKNNEESLTLDQFIRQLTAGSMTGRCCRGDMRDQHLLTGIGFITGLIVSIFSKLLVPLIGLGIVVTQVCFMPGHVLHPADTTGRRPLRHQHCRAPQEEKDSELADSCGAAGLSHLYRRLWHHLLPVVLLLLLMDP